MRLSAILAASAVSAFAALPAVAQALGEPVVAAEDPAALFTDEDPVLHCNKQAAYHITVDLLEAGHWDKADQWLTERYIQHNPNAASGRDGVVYFFTEVLGVEPKPIPDEMETEVVAVVAEDDLVTVAYKREMPVPGGAEGETYTTTWFDMWRFVDCKADEHWDYGTLSAR
jgi:predicted SnoaL-like aldol condensation-catalyzing enzyme